jgi:small subunit ribosomal protein S16
MVVIRLSRSGSKKRPFYHLSVADSRHPRDGRFIERVGFFNPIAKGKQERFRVSSERVDYWIEKGAQPSERVTYLMKQHAEQKDLPVTADVTSGKEEISAS